MNATYCIYINSTLWDCNEGHTTTCNVTALTPISPIGNPTWWTNNWCKTVLRNQSKPLPGTTFPRRLPAGWFLICGNRAWNGIPTRPIGGPCTIGQVSLALPHHHPNKSNPVRWKREITQILDNTCNDNVRLFNRWENFFLSLFVPGASAAAAHRKLESLSCWIIKQANLTSRVLSDLADGISKIQHAVLQNRMAIDFLLLAHGHGCEDFDGMCCMDLEDKSKSIHKKIQQLIEHSNNIKKDAGFFGLEGLTNWFGLEGWLKSCIKSILLIIIIVIVGLMCFTCLMSCVRKLIERMMNQTTQLLLIKAGYEQLPNPEDIGSLQLSYKELQRFQEQNE